MKNINSKLGILIAVFLTLFTIILSIKYYYDTYLMSLDGKVERLRKDIKENLYVTVSKKEHNFTHLWLSFQENVEVGDSVFKKPGEYDIVLVKKKGNKRLICKYEKQ